MFHELMLELAFLKPIYNGEKTFEIRKNDRGFQKGDRIRFKAVDALGLHIRTHLDEMEFEITYVLSGWLRGYRWYNAETGEYFDPPTAPVYVRINGRKRQAKRWLWLWRLVARVQGWLLG